jgi:glutamyl-Q tRNA(Asp) synthetase
VDDEDQGITDVVRGADLLASTPRQMLLQDALGLRRPSYMHVPLAVDANGLKLSKSSDAPGLASAAPVEQLVAALRFLGQEPPPSGSRGSVGEVLAWSAARWDPAQFAGVASRAVPE